LNWLYGIAKSFYTIRIRTKTSAVDFTRKSKKKKTFLSLVFENLAVI